MIKLDLYDRAIMKLLLESHRPLTTKQIASKIGISWNTALNHLEKLQKQGVVQEGK